MNCFMNGILLKDFALYGSISGDYLFVIKMLRS